MYFGFKVEAIGTKASCSISIWPLYASYMGLRTWTLTKVLVKI
jgi:hypothetical protein